MTPPEHFTITARQATDADASLPAFDFTKLSAINTCPTWGILRYAHHKTFSTGGRAMALEAGSALHDAFAAVRLAQLGYVEGNEAAMHYRGTELFGPSRWELMQTGVSQSDTQLMQLGLNALETSGYVDDPFDRRRTYSNLETALLLYIQRWEAERYPIYVNGDFIGIEQSFNLVCEIHTAADVEPLQFRLVGRIDGLHTNNGALIIGENKTASRIDDAWRQSFIMSHQVTGYMFAASVITGVRPTNALIWGLQIPLPKDMHSGLGIEMVSRHDHHYDMWVRWLYHTILLHHRYHSDPSNAPKYTHSCNRYFRPCSFIPFCSADDEEKAAILEEMVVDEWSPLHEKGKHSAE